MNTRAAAAPDLRANYPRRASASIDGIVWLPRVIDKARAFDAGTLGSYLYGQSPVDDCLLHAAGVTYAELLDIVRVAPTDADVVAGIEARAPGATERMRAFSRRPPLMYRAMLLLVDTDEGYISGRWGALAQKVAVTATKPIPPLMRLLRPMRSVKPRVR